MNIEVHSFESIRVLARNPFEVPTAVISIGDVGSAAPVLENRPDYFLRLEFDDIDLSWIEDYETCGKDAFRLFSMEQARQIVQFIENCWDKIGLLVCHCQYGHSRSAAVAAAIQQHFEGDGIRYFVDARYHPNVYVFSLVTEAFQELEEKNDGTV